MATIYKLPYFLSLSSHKLFLNHHHHREYKLCWKAHEDSSSKHFRICAASIKNPRNGRKAKSNAELCNDLREFILDVGLPEGHVPSLKELSNHGRTDLANIVRRRGYKLIRDLLSNSTKEDTDGSNLEKSLAEGHNAISDSADISTGQDEKVKDVIEDSSLSTEVPIISNQSDSTDIDLEYRSGDHNYMPIESSIDLSLGERALDDAERQDEEVKSMVEDVSSSKSSYNLEQQDEEVKHMIEDNSLSTPSYNVQQQNEEVLNMAVDNFLSTEVSIADNNMISDLNSNDNACMPIETSASFPLEEKAICNSKAQDENVNNIAEGSISLSTGVSNIVSDAKNVKNVNITSDLNFGDHSSISMATAANQSLEEKVAKFIQHGDLDAIEDNVYGILNESGTEESQGFSEPETATEICSSTPSKENFQHMVGRSNAALTMNGNLSTSTQAGPVVTVNHPIRNDQLSDESLASADLDKDLDVETRKKENQVEINHLKFMLHQKELELSLLKEQIEKEKLALSALQTKAETEISKAQKLISEKDAELLTTEESLSGLVEVKIQYCGDGEIVEVAGSFNGWHHRVKMDPEPSSSITDPIGSRKSRLWSTMLWLYPGVYEIKFIVDGRWRVDYQRESVTRAGFCNNILRVDG